MNKLFPALLTMLLIPASALANPACAVCTVAIGASLSLARKLGVEDAVVGLWAGALLCLLGYWTIALFERKKWNFPGRDALLILASVGMIGFIYVSDVAYAPVVIWHIFYLDPILFSAAAGMFIYIYSQKFYQWIKARNGGHAHFPFEKVVLPVALLTATSFYFTCFPI